MVLTSFAASMAVNTLVTGLFVFRILQVYLEIKPTSIERTLGSTGDTKFQHVIFIVIESGMALFTIQLVRVVLVILPIQLTEPAINGLNLVIGINTMLNVIIRFCFSFLPSFFVIITDKISISLDRASHQQ